MKKLSRLKKINLREVWQHEALHFTKWLAEEENLSLLGETLGLVLTDSETEQPAGDFKADILARDQDNNLVIIENQLERTDNNHLGQILTYASVREANTVIWIAAKARDEHKQAIEWLNQRTDSKANFFLLELEVWQIEDSSYAPKFNIVIAPNNWSKTVRSIASGSIGPLNLERRKFWEEFVDYSDKQDYEPLRNNLSIRGIGLEIKHDSIDGGHFFLGTPLRPQILSVELFILGDKELFDKLENQKEKIEKGLGLKLKWYRDYPHPNGNEIFSQIIFKKEGKFNDPERRQENIEWFYKTAKKFCEVFPKYF